MLYPDILIRYGEYAIAMEPHICIVLKTDFAEINCVTSFDVFWRLIAGYTIYIPSHYIILCSFPKLSHLIL